MKKILLALPLMATAFTAFAQSDGNSANFDEVIQDSDVISRDDVMVPATFALDAVIRDQAKPRGDLIVKAINIQKTISDDVSNNPIQLVVITVQNIGNASVHAITNEIQMNGTHIQTDVYGPNGVGGYNLGAPIGAGQQGQLTFYLAPNTLHHCQKLTGVIDTKHTLQFGDYSVFYNDGLNGVFVVDKKSIRACVGDIKKQ